MSRLRQFFAVPLGLCGLLWAGAACDARVEGGPAEVPARPQDGPVGAHATEGAAPTAPSGETVPTPTSELERPGASAVPHGRWRSDSICIELFENGDFEISLLDRPPKTLVMGSVGGATEDGDSVALDLKVERIWEARYTGKCRKVVRFGGFADDASVLGSRAAPGEALSLRIQRKSNDELELCGERCVTLKRDEPLLGARWRVLGVDYPTNPKASWSEGDLIEVDIDAHLGHVWIGRSGKKFATVYGPVVTQSLGGDRFELTFTRDPERDYGDSEGVTLFGRELEPGVAQVLQARRLPDQQLEVCSGKQPCVILERQFDSSDYSLR